MSQQNFNYTISNISTTYQTSPTLARNASNLVPCSGASDAVVMHVASSRINTSQPVQAICKAINHGLNLSQEGPPGVQKIACTCFSLPENQDREEKQVINYLQQWAADPQVGMDIRVKRSKVCDDVKQWLNDPSEVLRLKWNMLPNIFHMHAMQS